METVLTACRIGDAKLLKFLLARQSPRRADSKGYTGLHWAVKRFYIECVEILLADSRLNVNAKTKDSGSTALHLCLSSRLRKNKRLLLMKMLISKGADMNR
jgi:ankyrin repeat protein